MNEEVVNRLIEVLSSSTSMVLVEYTHYFTWVSLLYLCIGVVFGLAAYLVKKPESWEKELFIVLKCLLVVLSFTFITLNAKDLVSPKASAIHQIIKDIKQ